MARCIICDRDEAIFKNLGFNETGGIGQEIECKYCKTYRTLFQDPDGYIVLGEDDRFLMSKISYEYFLKNKKPFILNDKYKEFISLRYYPKNVLEQIRYFLETVA